MSEKRLPCSEEKLREIVEQFGTPFHIYDEAAIRENALRFAKAFDWAPKFCEHYAVKALPNPHILKVLAECGCGADCSSLPEVILAEKSGMTGEQIVFTSNDTEPEEFIKAAEAGAVFNLDDITHVEFVEKVLGKLPELVSFRYNPGPLRDGGNDIIGTPEESKYGLTHAQIFEAIEMCKAKEDRWLSIYN